VSQLPLGVENFGLQNHNTGEARYFREFLRDKMNQWCATHFKSDGNPYNLYKDGLKIFTTINSKMQRYAEEAVREHLANDLQPTFYKVWKGIPNAPFDLQGTPEQIQVQVQQLMDQAMRRSDRYRRMKEEGYSEDSIEKAFNTPVEMRVFSWKGDLDTTMTPMDSIRYYKYFLLAGLMSMETTTGFVRAYVGGIDFKYFKYDHVTQAKRQVGSAFKPFVYTLAMQEGEYSPCYKVPNIQYSVPWDGKYWTPENADNEDVGKEVTLKWALATSNNWIAAWLIRQFSPQSVIQMARNMGVTSPIPAVPSIALGTADISLEEMTGAMNTFADKGVYIKPIFVTKIEDKNGDVLYQYKPRKNEAMSEITAYKMIKLLEGVVESGTGVRLGWKYGFRNPIAGKTGTSQHQSDGWFMGIVPKLTTGVWVGAEDRSVHFHTITLGQGANMALPIWALYMKKIYADPSLGISQKDDFQKPLKNIDVEFDCKKYDKVHKKATPDGNIGDHF
jgi:penicillin-binding protein 1A